ncbi:L-PSP endoribonuclease family protein [Talaromyces proteolyticus]|uniref:L-PSP endoribonuclease family protein n=1 Tax=Talaromyces proteolyticus TaxID=1131652 RepID=A0AAD4KXC5_9EURO|nr:L-PSP endoribonuclease family protein [Talaromyces proteolyticus]KAH8703271.1 L-PSP endoribonuclease family protein [Talaromyces proteolyticus]
MSHPEYFNYEGLGKINQQKYKYSQAVRVGDRIECAGQGGWDPQTGILKEDVEAQINQTFKNVDLALKTAGGTGWNQVFRLTSYHVSLDSEVMKIMVENFKKHIPDHEPLWTCVGVERLARPDMKVEIEAAAYDSRSLN